MNVRRYMKRGAVTVPPEAPASRARDLMEEHGYGLLLVASDNGELVGFITRAGLKDVADAEAPMERFAHPVRFAVSPDDTLEKAALILLANRLVVLPVVDGGKLIGVITQGELLKGLTRGLGIGLEAMRLTVSVRNGSQDLYDVLFVLREHGARIVSLTEAGGGDGIREVVLRVQGVDDREKLRGELESVLRSARCTG